MVWVVPQYSFFLLPHMSKKRAVVRHFSEVAIGQICVPYLEAWNHICCLHSFIINFFMCVQVLAACKCSGNRIMVEF